MNDELNLLVKYIDSDKSLATVVITVPSNLIIEDVKVENVWMYFKEIEVLDWYKGILTPVITDLDFIVEVTIVNKVICKKDMTDSDYVKTVIKRQDEYLKPFNNMLYNIEYTCIHVSPIHGKTKRYLKKEKIGNNESELLISSREFKAITYGDEIEYKKDFNILEVSDISILKTYKNIGEVKLADATNHFLAIMGMHDSVGSFMMAFIESELLLMFNDIKYEKDLNWLKDKYENYLANKDA